MALLFHDAAGLEVIAASARFGRGLPARAVPFGVNQATQVGHDAMLSALAMGAAEVVVLLDPAKREEAARSAEEAAQQKLREEQEAREKEIAERQRAREEARKKREAMEGTVDLHEQSNLMESFNES